MLSFDTTQQFDPSLLEEKDKELLEKGLFSFIQLRQLWDKSLKAAKGIQNYKEEGKARKGEEALFIELARNLEEICNKNLSGAQDEKNEAIFLPMKIAKAAKYIKTINSNFSFELSEEARELYLCLDYEENSGYLLKIKTNDENFIFSNLALAGEGEQKEKGAAFSQAEALAFLWLCWEKIETSNKPEDDLVSNFFIPAEASKTLNNVLEYMENIKKNLKYKQKKLTFSKFLKNFTVPQNFLKEITAFYFAKHKEYFSYLLSQNSLAKEEPVEFKHFNEAINKEVETLIKQIFPLEKLPLYFYHDTEFLENTSCKSDLGASLNFLAPQFSFIKVNPFSQRYLVPNPEAFKKDKEIHFYVNLLDENNYKITDKIIVIVEKERKTEERSLRKTYLEAADYKKIELAINMVPGRHMFTELPIITDIHTKDIRNCFLQPARTEETYLSNIFLNGQPASTEDISNTDSREHFYDGAGNKIFTVVDHTPEGPSVCQNINLKGEYVILLTYGDYAELEVEAIGEETVGEKQKEALKKDYAEQYSEAEFSFYLFMNFLLKFSEVLALDRTKGKKLVREMEKQLKALLEVYNFVVVVSNMAKKYELLKLL